ncbi:MAG: Gfo/Idh/MocA family oxidoreductase [Herpetosiphonaceae bacterium]|nr:Gfo/Idh/MocA family oxidoreductase [Herpetosiphonaceae bacterium]
MDLEADRRQEPRLRYAFIGSAATIVSLHLKALAQLPADIVGMADVDAERGAARASEVGCPFFAAHRPMLDKVRPDVVVITTPHPFHPALAIDAFAAGAHVLVEKPMAIDVAAADQMIDAAKQAQRLLAVNFQQRFRPDIERAKTLIEAGAIGPLVRVLCVEPWYRSAAYYRSAAWRGKWKTEGGGVLMNQAPHTLDLLCYLVGMPAKVWGWTRTLEHAIECEDTAQAMLEYPNGAPGYFTASTVEAGSKRRLHIVGDCGSIELTGDQLTVTTFTPSLKEFLVSTPELFAEPDNSRETMTLPGDGGGHLAVHRDLYRSIIEGHSPRCDGRQGLMSLELANAIVLSSYTERPVTLPLDRSAYADLLADLQAGRRR